MTGQISETPVINYKVEYQVRNESGDLLGLVRVVAVDVETGTVATMYDGPFIDSMEVTSDEFSGANMAFYLRKGTYDISITEVSTGNQVILPKYYVGNILNLSEDLNDFMVFAWQRHIVANDGTVINNPKVSVERYETATELRTAMFLPSLSAPQIPVYEYTYVDYVLLYVPTGLYRITVRDINNSVIRIFDHVSIGVSMVDTRPPPPPDDGPIWA